MKMKKTVFKFLIICLFVFISVNSLNAVPYYSDDSYTYFKVDLKKGNNLFMISNNTNNKDWDDKILSYRISLPESASAYKKGKGSKEDTDTISRILEEGEVLSFKTNSYNTNRMSQTTASVRNIRNDASIIHKSDEEGTRYYNVTISETGRYYIRAYAYNRYPRYEGRMRISGLFINGNYKINYHSISKKINDFYFINFNSDEVKKNYVVKFPKKFQYSKIERLENNKIVVDELDSFTNQSNLSFEVNTVLYSNISYSLDNNDFRNICDYCDNYNVKIDNLEEGVHNITLRVKDETGIVDRTYSVLVDILTLKDNLIFYYNFDSYNISDICGNGNNGVNNGVNFYNSKIGQGIKSLNQNEYVLYPQIDSISNGSVQFWFKLDNSFSSLNNNSIIFMLGDSNGINDGDFKILLDKIAEILPSIFL